MRVGAHALWEKGFFIIVKSLQLHIVIQHQKLPFLIRPAEFVFGELVNGSRIHVVPEDCPQDTPDPGFSRVFDS